MYLSPSLLACFFLLLVLYNTHEETLLLEDHTLPFSFYRAPFSFEFVREEKSFRSFLHYPGRPRVARPGQRSKECLTTERSI